LAAIGCGDSKDEGNGGGNEDAGTPGGGGTDDAGGTPMGTTRTWSGTLVQVLAQDTSAPIKTPHKITAVDNETGVPLEGGKYSTMTSSTDGTWALKDVPMDKPIAIHLEGTGSATEGTYDAITINVTNNSVDEPLTRVSAAGTATTAEMVAGYKANQAAAGLSIGVYHVVNKQRKAIIGCVKAVLDDSEDLTKAADLRYVTAGGLPSAMQPMTESNRGAMLFGNIPKGKHKIKLTVDDGKTYFGETEFTIFKSRDEASSAFKSILFFMAIDVPENKTPAGCM
jgi:hypothetical protein